MTSLSFDTCTRQRRDPALRRLARWMLALVALPFALGVINMVLKSVLDDADQAENRIEWIAALAMQTWLVLLYFAWRKTGFRVSVNTTSDGAPE